MVDVVIYNPANFSPVANGDLVLTSGGREWGVIDARARRLLNEPGDGSVEIPADHPNAARLTYRNVVRLIEDGEVIKSFVVNELNEVTAADDDSKLVRKASGEGLLGRFKEMLVLPPNGTTGLPLSYLRRHDWAAPETSADGWTDTVYEMDRAEDVLFGIYRPVAWPTPIAPDEPLGIYWVHTVPSGDPHPSGTQYWHREFTLAASTEMAFFVTAADQFEFAIDGVVVLEAKLTGPNSVWFNTWKIGVRLAAGTRTIRIKVDVINATGQGGMICAGFNSGSDGIDDLVVFTGDGEWSVIDNPATPPGQTPGQIINLVHSDASLRGCPTPSLDFTDDEDTAGDPWDETIPLTYRVPCTLYDVIEQLGTWIDVDMPDDAYMLRAYNVSTGVGDPASTVELDGVIYTGLNGTA